MNSSKTETSELSIAEFKDRLHRRGRKSSPKARLLPVESRGNRVSLSFAQERLWVLEQMGVAGSAYHIPIALRIFGALDEDALSATFADLIERHESLRTRFENKNGQGVQVIDAAISWQLEVQDLRELNSMVREKTVQELVLQVSQAKFYLERGPLMRVRLIKIGELEQVLVVTLHHLITDGWSMGVMVRELSELYAARCEGRESRLASLPIQYADYTVWQRDWLQGDVLNKQLQYWQNQLKDAPGEIALPTDRGRPAILSFRGGAAGLKIGKVQLDFLQALAQREGATLYMVLLGIFQVLLSRLSGQQDIVIGTPIAGRTHKETEGLIGFFVNTLALRVQVSENESFQAHVRCVKEMTLNAYAHQDLPFERLVQALNPVRDLSRQPIFQVAFAMQNVPEEELNVSGLRWQPLSQEGATAKFDLEFALQETVNGLVGNFVYATDLFDGLSIARMARQYERLAEQIARDATQPLSSYELLSREERHRILVEWNETKRSYGTQGLIHELFAEQASRTPDAIAVVYEEEQLSYGELDRRSNQLAHYLREQGVGPEVCVGICMERSVELLIGMLGILKAGGAYVPLDPSYPRERIEYVLKDSQARILLSQARVMERFGNIDRASLPCLCLDKGGMEWGEKADSFVEGSALSPLQSAYVIYTSGSSGRPKGVMATHAGVVNYMNYAIERYEVEKGRGAPVNTPLVFDATVTSVLTPLMVGRTVELVASGEGELAELTNRLAQGSGYSLVKLTPAHLDVMEQLDSRSIGNESANYLVIGGEALQATQIEAWRTRAPQVKLINEYGPTETVVGCAVYEVDVQTGHVGSVPIGRPISNTDLYILDRAMQPAPIGVAGELYIGGAGLARGYLNRPGLTSERFVPHPFDARGGERLYRTGDACRYLSDGNIEFIGRIDNQVKIRGFRIELGEIESRLNEHPEVEQSVVIAQEDEQSNKRLIAYYTEKQPEGEGAARLTSVELRAYLQSRLPEYMVPAAFVFLQKLPLTLNGKIDRKGLPAPEGESYSRGEYEAPQGKIEASIAAIWQELLKVERVGRHDNFFELGGHSLLIVRLIARLKRVGMHADVGSIVAYPTLKALAEKLSGERRTEMTIPENRITMQAERIIPELLPLIALNQAEIDRVVEHVPGGAKNIQDIYPLAPLQEGILFHYLMNEQGDTYLSQLLLAFDDREYLDRFLVALQSVIDRHDILRTGVMWEGLSEGVQVVWREAPLPIEEVKLAAGDVAAQLRERFDSRRYRLDVRQAPLARAVIARDGASERWLLLLLNHHLAMDHATLDIIIAEVQAHLSGSEQQLPAPLPFRNFVAQARLGRQAGEDETFFKEMLEKVTEPTLPFGLQDVQGDGGQRVESYRALEQELVSRIREQARANKVSVASLCHVAFAQVLARVSSQARVVFGTILFGRMGGSEGADRVLGMFINTLPICIEIDGRNVRESVQQTHRLLAELMRHEHASLALAQRCSGVATGTPLFSALLNYRHNQRVVGEGAAAWEGMEVLHSEERTNYPLTLSVEDDGEGLGFTTQASGVEPERVNELMHTALLQLTEALEHTPGIALQDLDVLPAAEKHRLLVEWNETHQEYPRDKLIHELFEEQAQQTPDAMAVVYEDEQLSYGELDRRSNQLAHYLREQGVGPEVCVGICMERSVELLIGMLGILKAGGAYVPIDPSYPEERLQFMLEDVAPRVVLIQEKLRDRLPERFIEVMALDSEWSIVSAGVVDDCAATGMGLTSDHLAYVIYTSGSTGQPKGVSVSHRAVNRLVKNCTYAQLVAETVMAQGANISFDAATFEIWGALLNGAKLIVLNQSLDLEGIAKAIGRHRVGTLWLTSALFNALVETDIDELLGVDQLLVGGEALSPRHIEKGGNRLKETTLINGYGPTECTTFSCTYQIPKGRNNRVTDNVPIGRPIDNTQLYILDGSFELVPIGSSGELYIGGAGLARGYLNRPGLTSERFVPHPFDARGGERLYRTGDACRYLSDGNIEFIGRIDNQVKIRGFRIELGEIESRLNEHPEVEQSVVIAQEDEQSNKRLIAYYTEKQPEGEGAARLTSVELRAYLQSRLPEYMVPAAFVFLQKLPLTLNGKIDRKGLPAPDGESYSRGEYEAPEGGMEEKLAEIWQTLLKVERVGRHDNFFELGGDSIDAMRMIAVLREVMVVEVPVRMLFEAQTLAEQSERIGKVRGEQGVLSKPALMAQARGNRVALSYAQERLWVLEQIGLSGSAYHVAIALRIAGELEEETFGRSVEQLIARHESLRTRFVNEGGQGVQVIDSVNSFRLTQEDLRELPEEARAEALRRRVSEEAAARFDLESGPLLRVKLIKIGDQESVLLMTLHHLITDGWSMGVMVRELSELYRSGVEGRESQLKALPIQYADYALWQREWLQGEALEEQLRYWKEQLADAPEEIDLPRDRVRASVPSFQGGGQGIFISKEVAAQLVALAKRASATPYMVMLGIFQILLSRLSGQSDIVVGTPIAGRMHKATEGLIGFFVNTLALRIRVDEQETFAEYLRRVKEVTLGAYAHQELPIERLVQELKPVRDLSRQPIFQVMFSFQNAPVEELEIANLTWQPVTQPATTAKFDLELSLQETAAGLGGVLSYSMDLFDPASVERMARQYERLVEQVAADAHRALWSYELLSREEKNQLLVEWNDTHKETRTESLIHELCDEQCAKSPDAVAVLFEDEHLTYERLNRRSNQLARYLTVQGVGPEVRVGICMERSTELLIGILGILKVGGAYVPIDPAFPNERIDHVLRDAEIEILLTHNAAIQQLQFQDASRLKCLRVDTEVEKYCSYASSSLSYTARHSLQSVYAIYTSGSTGKPKGAANTHRGVANRLKWMQREYQLEAGERVLQKTPFSFDVSVWELLWPIVNGGCVVFAKPEGHKDPSYLQEVMQRCAVNVVHFVPSMLHAYLRFSTESLPSLREVVCSGEALELSVQKEFFEKFPDARLHNLYGPTEASIDVSYWQCDPTSAVVPIGRPIDNTELYILDAKLRPVPVGVKGELYIGGVGLARGYLNRTSLTAERFVPHPFTGKRGERLYRTGDLARYLADGNIEYMGRIDSQVKIRGFRIELGEIENCLNEHPGIGQNVVIARDDGQNNKRLIAYYTQKDLEPVSAVALREYIRHRLPEYMVPAVFVSIESLPLTANGKVDRKSLPSPDLSNALKSHYVAPRNEIEAHLCAIWAAVLNVERVGIFDNFFEIGGDSILSIEILAKARESGLRFELRELFSYQRVAELAPHVGMQASAQPIRSAPFELLSDAERMDFVAQQTIEDAYPLGALQAGMVFHSELDGSAVYHDIFSYHLGYRFEESVFRDALSKVVESHAVLRTGFALFRNERPLQIVYRNVELPIRLEDLSSLTEDEQAQAIDVFVQAEKNLGFDYAHAPLFRLFIHIRSADSFQYTLSFHHAILDGWSVASLQTELFNTYQQLLLDQYRGPVISRGTYRDFIATEQAALASKESREYWLSSMNGAPINVFPWTRRASQTPRVMTYGVGVDSEMSAQLNRIANEIGVPLKSVLLAAHLKVMSVLSGQSEIVTGTMANGRLEEVDGRRMLGLFLNTLPLRLSLGRSSWRELIGATFQAEQAMLPHRRYPLSEIQRLCGRGQLFDVVLNFVHFHVYRELQTTDAIAIKGMTGFEQTSFLLTVNVIQSVVDKSIALSLMYDAGHFSSEDIVRMAGYYQRAMQSIVAETDAEVIQQSVLSEQEIRQLCVEWNETKRSYGTQGLIHELFAEQASRTPDAIAVVYEEEQLSYGELDRRSNQLAHYLREQGVGPEVCVGICMERSVELLIGMLGILKAGGAYVPLDPSYPRERIEYVLKDSQARILLSQARVMERFGNIDRASLPCLCLDKGGMEWGEKADSFVEGSALSPLQSAYVIYTSGSSGRPKGVMATHAGVVNYMNYAIERYEVEKGRGAPVNTPLVFDATVTSVLTPLMVGRTVELVASGEGELAELTNRLAQGSGYSLVKLTPAHLDVMEQLDSRSIGNESANYLVIGGEALQATQIEAWRTRAPQVKLINEYGPTETVVGCAVYEVDVQTGHVGSVPIGRPISNTDLYILDRAMQPAPIGVAGELYIGGAGLARGYLNRPGLTSERFVPHPFDARGGERLYRTGDACRYLSDGNIEFIGRIDNQVKIRGFRIELGEIESRLNEHPEVEQSVVIAQEDEQSNKRLIAYYTEKQPEGEGAARLTSVELRAYLQSRLPEYMVPAAFVFLQKLPLTLNGKIDRKGLPAPEGESYSRGEYEAPQGKIEASIAAIWQELLKVERVGRHDNFFELGGHSLLIVRLIARLKRVGMHADVGSIVAYPTLKALAEKLSGERRTEMTIPENRITMQAERIIPELLPLIALNQAEIDRVVEHVPGGAKNIQDIYPLAPLQEGILFHYLMNEQGDTYLSQLLLAFDDREYLDRFLVALQSVIDRHDILRTGVMWEGLSEGVQVVWREAPLPIEEVKLAAGDVAAQLRERFDSRRYRLDVRQAPLARAVIARDGASERWLLLLLNHHLAMDHATLDIIIAEVQAHLSGSEQQLPAPLPFRNFVAQARLGRQAGEDETFFKEMLEKVTEPTLPFGLQDVQGDGGQRVESYRALEQELVSRIREQARANKVSVASLCHVAFAQVLARVSSQARVVFGTILFGRMGGSEGADRVLGMFINTLPICIEIDGRNVRESVQQTHRLLAELMRHEHASLALAQRCSGVATGTPLFSALLNYRHNQRVVGEGAAAWEGMEVLHSEERTNYPLTLSVEDDGEGLGFTTQASGVEPERVNELMHTALLQLTEALEHTPGIALQDLDVLPAAEKHRLLVEWNETHQEYPRDKLIHELFEEQAQQTPDAMAVVYEDEQLSYGELDRRSNQLAHYLREQGVGPEVCVGICMERSVELLIGMLGILKAGGAYVPLDPSYPKERLDYMLGDSRCLVLLVSRRAQNDWSRTSALRIVVVDSKTDDLHSCGSFSKSLCRAGNLAYLIYTSGSTGRPKGVAITHRNAVAFLSWAMREFDDDQVIRVLASTSICFDLSVFEIFFPLSTGRTIVLAEDVLQLSYMIGRETVDLCNTVPSAMNALIREQQVPRRIRVVNLAGEALHRTLVERIYTETAVEKVFNLYGPSEDTTYSLWTMICRDETRQPPIGIPIDNTRALILDRELRLLPIGVTGELYLAGSGLSRGYWDRPGLTAERFVPDPFGAEEGERLYRTGDACRYLSDGNIEFIGRIDSQVKIRGFRIELGEIENCLNEHAQIQHSVVIAKEDEQNNKRLIAYYIEKQSAGEDTARLTSAELRSYVQSRLPEHMAPSAYVYLDALPLTVNGKVDRKGLPAPEEEALNRSVYQAPEGEREELIATIWQELLKVERVGRNDNFFELGGNSLLIIGLIERLKIAGLHGDVRRIFSASTLREVAEELEQRSFVEVIVPANRMQNLEKDDAEGQFEFEVRI